MSYGLNRITPSGGSALDSSSPHPDAAPASAAVLSAHSAGFEVGTRIVIRGLKAQPEFNGCAGEIVSPEENGRWGVVLDQGDGIKVSARRSKEDFCSRFSFSQFNRILKCPCRQRCPALRRAPFDLPLLSSFSGPNQQYGKLRHRSAASRLR
jgi:hypothetical protein